MIHSFILPFAVLTTYAQENAKIVVPVKPVDAIADIKVAKPKESPKPSAGSQNSPNQKTGAETTAAGAAPAAAVNNQLVPSVPSPQTPQQLADAVSATQDQAPDFSQIRDPFKQPAILVSKSIPKSPLETFPVDGLKMVAVMSGPKKRKALIKAPDGNNYIVMEKMPVGLRGGLITKITADAILIREKVVNIVGEEEGLDTVLKMETAPEVASGQSSTEGT